MYRFQIQRLGPVQLVLGGILAGGLVVGAILFASFIAIAALVVGLLATAAGVVTYALRRFLPRPGSASMERRAQGIVVVERGKDSGARLIEVEVVEETKAPGPKSPR